MTAKSTRNQSDWNGIDWYVNLGEANASRNWDDARRYGFVSAGGRKIYSDAIQRMQVGDRVFAYIPKVGYVGIGTVAGTAAPADRTSLTVAGAQVAFRSLEVNAPYGKVVADPDPDEDYREWILPVASDRTVDRERALRGTRAVHEPEHCVHTSRPVHDRPGQRALRLNTGTDSIAVVHPRHGRTTQRNPM